MKTTNTKHCKNNVHLLKFNEFVCAHEYYSCISIVLNETEVINAICFI
jgi:hypothetical protein